MRFTSNQIDRLADARFSDRLVQVIASIDASAPAELRSPDGQRMLAALVARAQGHGFQSELDIGRFVITAWMLGVDFDSRLPAMQEILAEPRLTGSAKADAIESVATMLLDQLHQGRSA